MAENLNHVMSDIVEVTFITATYLHKFHMQTDVVIDPNTGYPYEFAIVHGNTWQTTFSPVIEYPNEAFTPCAGSVNHRGIYQYNKTSQAYEIYKPAKSSTNLIYFHTPTGIVEFNVEPEAYTDPNTGKPYPYVHVHGKTWQTEFITELPDYSEAFTPGAPKETNHRGTYYYCAQSHAYIKMYL